MKSASVALAALAALLLAGCDSGTSDAEHWKAWAAVEPTCTAVAYASMTNSAPVRIYSCQGINGVITADDWVAKHKAGAIK